MIHSSSSDFLRDQSNGKVCCKAGSKAATPPSKINHTNHVLSSNNERGGELLGANWNPSYSILSEPETNCHLSRISDYYN